jgi:pilus assembly protein CpaB
MSARKFLLLLGVALIISGLGLAVIWTNRLTQPAAPVVVRQEPSRPALLTALHRLSSGTLLREGDIGWKEIAPGQNRPGQLLRGEVSDTEFLGAITRRDFAEGEPLVASELVKPSDRRFLAAVLRPNRRAVSISVDAPQSASGLVLPGDYVDVILTQDFGDAVDRTQRSVGETVLHNVRVVAVDQSLGAAKPPASGQGAVPGGEARLPKTITLELDERQAQVLFVAMQLGKLQLAIRPLEGSGLARADEARGLTPTWASDVSRAIVALSAPRPSGVSTPAPASTPRVIPTGSTIEHLVRRPPSTAQ